MFFDQDFSFFYSDGYLIIHGELSDVRNKFGESNDAFFHGKGGEDFFAVRRFMCGNNLVLFMLVFCGGECTRFMC